MSPVVSVAAGPQMSPFAGVLTHWDSGRQWCRRCRVPAPRIDRWTVTVASAAPHLASVVGVRRLPREGGGAGAQRVSGRRLQLAVMVVEKRWGFHLGPIMVQ